MGRNQFTFYSSFWSAAKSLPNRERLAFMDAVCTYVFEDTILELSGGAAGMFTLVLPVLKAGNRKARGGMRGVPGTSGKDSGKTLESSDKEDAKLLESSDEDTAKEKKKEDKIEIADECPPPQPPQRGGARQNRRKGGNVFAELLREELP